MSGDLSVTALYTAQVAVWAGLPCSELLATVDGKRVFDVTNAALGVARLVRPDLPALRYTLLHRQLMIDHLLGEQVGSVVELAAGLSRRGAANCHDRGYTEIDLPAVSAKKRELLERSVEGRAVLDKLTLIAGDATEIELPASDIVIAEGLVMYLDAAARQRLFAHVRAPRFIFDVVPIEEEPPPGRIGRLLERGMKRSTGGRSFERDLRTRDQVRDELHTAGFVDVEAIAASNIAREWCLPHAEQKTTMVVFSASRGRRA